MHPHGRGRATPDARGHVSDLCRVGHDHKITTQRDVRPARDSKTMDLADHRFHGPKQRHKGLRIGPHHLVILHRVPGHGLGDLVLRVLRIVGQIVARAKSAPSTGQDHHMHIAILIRLRYRRFQLVGQIVVDGVHHLWSVQGDPTNAAVFFIKHLGHIARLCCLSLWAQAGMCQKCKQGGGRGKIGAASGAHLGNLMGEAYNREMVERADTMSFSIFDVAPMCQPRSFCP